LPSRLMLSGYPLVPERMMPVLPGPSGGRPWQKRRNVLSMPYQHAEYGAGAAAIGSSPHRGGSSPEVSTPHWAQHGSGLSSSIGSHQASQSRNGSPGASTRIA